MMKCYQLIKFGEEQSHNGVIPTWVSIIREQSPIRRFLVVHHKVLRPPKHGVQPNQYDPNHTRNDDVEPHVSEDQSHHRHQGKKNHHDPVRDRKPEHLEGLVTQEVEYEPRGKDDQEDDDGERVVEEAEEEHDQGDQGVVGPEVGQVLDESGRRVGEIGGESKCGGFQELTPWPERGPRRLGRFLELGHHSGGHCEMGFSESFELSWWRLMEIGAEGIRERWGFCFDIRHHIVKKRIDAHGNVIEAKKDGIGAPKIEKPLQRHGGRLEHNEKYCGSCFGAETSDDDCCNSCDEVREAYRKKGWALTNAELIDQCEREGFIQKVKDEDGEGCNIEGSLEVNKVAGNFHFIPGKSFHQSNVHLHDLLAFQTDSYNISHKINRLAFGDYFPGVQNPLDGVQWMQERPSGIYQYFIKVVPTIYTNIRGRTIFSNQYSVTEHYKSLELGYSHMLPGVFFFYDLSPIKVTFKEEHVPFLHFMTHICAIIGGIFTVAGLIDSFIYHGQRAIKKKIEAGKFG